MINEKKVIRMKKKIFIVLIVFYIVVTIFNNAIFAKTNRMYNTAVYSGNVEINKDVKDNKIAALFAKFIFIIGNFIEFIGATIVGWFTNEKIYPWADRVIFNTLPFLDVNFINPEPGSLFLPIDSTGSSKFTLFGLIIQKIYYSIFQICILFLGVIIGVMAVKLAISSLASEKAKYKKAIQNWFMAIILIFVVHYLMSFIFFLNEKLVEVASNIVSFGSLDVKNGNSEFYFDITTFQYTDKYDYKGTVYYVNNRYRLSTNRAVDEEVTAPQSGDNSFFDNINKLSNTNMSTKSGNSDKSENSSDQTGTINQQKLSDTINKLPEIESNNSSKSSTTNNNTNSNSSTGITTYREMNEKLGINTNTNTNTNTNSLSTGINTIQESILETKKNEIVDFINRARGYFRMYYIGIGKYEKLANLEEDSADSVAFIKKISESHRNDVNNEWYNNLLDKFLDTSNTEYDDYLLDQIKTEIINTYKQFLIDSDLPDNWYLYVKEIQTAGSVDKVSSDPEKFFAEMSEFFKKYVKDNGKYNLVIVFLYIIFLVQSFMFFISYIKRFFYVITLALFAPIVVVYDLFTKTLND